MAFYQTTPYLQRLVAFSLKKQTTRSFYMKSENTFPSRNKRFLVTCKKIDEQK